MSITRPVQTLFTIVAIPASCILAQSELSAPRSPKTESFKTLKQEFQGVLKTSILAIFVLDAKGVIRYKDIRGEELEKAVNVLLAEKPDAVAARAAE